MLHFAILRRSQVTEAFQNLPMHGEIEEFEFGSPRLIYEKVARMLLDRERRQR